MDDPFAGLPRNHYGAILADPPWYSPVFRATHHLGPLLHQLRLATLQLIP